MNDNIVVIPDTPETIVTTPIQPVPVIETAKLGVLYHAPLATTLTPGIVQIGTGLLVSAGLLSLDQSFIKIENIALNGTILVPDDDKTVNINLTKNDVGLNNVDNTADLDKPVSTATQTALNTKFDKQQDVLYFGKILYIKDDGTVGFKTENVEVNEDAFVNVSLDTATGVLTFTKENGNTVSIDFPLEELVSDGYYDTDTQEIVLVLANGNEIRFSAAALVDIYDDDSATITIYTDSETGHKTIKVADAVIGRLSDVETLASNNQTALAGKQDTLTFDNSPTENSDNPVKSGGIYTALSGKQATIDSSHKLSADLVDDTSATNKFVTSSDITAWNGKQDALTFDTSPTDNSTNPVTSGGVYTALSGKQATIDSSHKLSADLVDDTSTTNKFVTATDITNWNGKQDALTFDTTPTSESTNPITSGAVYTALGNKQNTLTTAQQNAVDSGITSALVTQIGTNQTNIGTINEKIPTQATSNNQLADKAFVNSSINALAAYYITKNAAGDPFATKAELTAATTFYSGGVARVPTTNDYCIVLADESKESTTGDDPTTRYSYQGSQWEYQYTINDTPLTAEQLSALNSGITSELVTQIGTNTTAISGKQDALPTTSTAGQVLTSTSTSGTTTWSTPQYITITTTSGSEAISDGTNSLNVATRNTAQTISGVKTFSASPLLNNALFLQGKNSGGSAINLVGVSASNNVLINNENSENTLVGGARFAPVSGQSSVMDLGGTNNLWKNFFLSGFIGSSSNSSYGLKLPSTSDWTANKTIATTDQIPTVNNATLTIQLNGDPVNSFSANASSNVTANIQALPNFTNVLRTNSYVTARLVKFISVNYSTYSVDKAASFTLSAMSGTNDSDAFAFLEDIVITVEAGGNVNARVYKKINVGSVSLNSETVYPGDICYVRDTTNSVIDFYIVCNSQYSRYTPIMWIGTNNSTLSTLGIYQYSGIETVYSTGTKTWISGSKTRYALSSEIPTTTSSVTENSTSVLTSGGAYTALAGKQDTLTFDDTPTASSNNPVKSGGVYTALDGKVDKVSGKGLSTDDFVSTNYYTKTQVDGIISSVYKPAGSVAFASLPTLAAGVLGNVYNVTDSFTTTSDFVEGSGTTYPAGTNVVVVDASSTSTPDYKFDVLSGFVDLSGYQPLITSSNKLDYSLLNNTPTIPTVNDATLTIQFNGTTVNSFTANASSNVTANIKALPNYSLSIGNTNGGNPRQVLFCSVNYTNFDSNSGAYFKLGAMSGHGNGVSYTFVEDIFINVSYTGTVSCQVYKYVQASVTLDGVTRNYGDVFYTIDTTNKIVYFYILLGQYSAAQFTPATKIGAAKAVTSANGIIQNSGSPTYYSSGEKVWATGNSALYVRSSDLATVATTGSYDDLTNKPTIPSAVTSINGLSGGSLTSPLVITGGDAATAAKIALDQTASGQITNNGTQTLFGFTSNNATSLTVGHSSYTLALRGSGSRPKFNGNDLSLAADASPVTYVTTEPSAANTTGLKVALLDSEPSTKYDGWIYMIKES